MAEYIEREAAIKVLYYNADESCASVVADFEALPAADVAPVVHGQWMDDIADGKHVRVCSCCGSIIPTDTTMDYLTEADNRFCYFCGAKMEEVR